jgi:adenylate cyclase
MEAPDLKRKLVAILAGDFEGFSRHMERDEAGTLAVLSSHRRTIDAAISQFGGRITGTAGDSVLAEFESVVSAINCAVQIQQALAEENSHLDLERRLFLRIGINVGDVMVKDGDIFGDGVNIAARLEALADPGGICVSRGVRDHLRKHRIVAFDDLGEQKVKNIAEPVRAFRVRIGAAPPNEEGDSESDDLPSETLAETGLESMPSPVAGQVTGSARPDEEAVAVEIAFWEAAKDSTNPAELHAYLQRYPEGEFVALAKARLQSLREIATESAIAEKADEVELTFWNSIKDSRDPDMFRAYLHKYPKGAFADLAQINLNRTPSD